MGRPINPYVAGAPLHGERGFFGRQDTLDWVARGLRNPATNGLVLFGQRRIGKTSLLLQLQRTLPADAFLPIYFDLQDQATRPLGQVLADLSGTVAEQAGLESPDPETFDDQGLFFRRTFLPQVYEAIGQNRRPVFLLDEFQVLDKAAEAELPDIAAVYSLFRFTRRVMTKDRRPAFAFAVGRRTDDLNVDFTATFKASLVREIWVLDQESAEALIRQAEAPDQPEQNVTLRFTNRAVARILNLTNCHPYLTQLLCLHIWERAYAESPTTPPRIDMPEVEAAVPYALEAGDQALTWLWNGLSPAEKVYAATLAEVAGERETISEDQGIQALTAHAARLRTPQVELAPRDLVRRRVLEMTEECEHRFAVELFRRWLHRHKPLRDAKGELDQVDPLADRLFGIGQGFFQRHRWETAIRYFRDALDAYPHHFYARLRLGETLLELGRTDEAIAELEQAYELDRDEAHLPLARALVIQARAREKAGDEDEALAACERALQIRPNEHTAREIQSAIWMRRLEAKARNYEQAEQWAEAATVCEQLVTHAPDEESQAAWQATLERCQKEALLARLFDEGLGAFRKKDWQRAQRAFAKVVRGRPDYKRKRQLAARLLLQAVSRKSVRKYAVVLAAVALHVILVTIVAGVWYFQPWKEEALASPVELPEHWEHVRTYNLDTNRDGNQEWVILYRFDLPTETGQAGSPIAGVVYQSNSSNSLILTPYELRPQDDDYLCECECTANMEDVLSGLPGPELIVRDRCYDETTRLTIFHWEPSEDKYLSQGLFFGSRIEAELDKVIVDQRLLHRAQLALRQIYRPRDNETYYYPFNGDVLIVPEKYELVFYQPEPEDVTQSPYPEKVVLAFYNHYTDDEQASVYFTENGWEQLRGCGTGQCGCTSTRSEITHVRVTDLQAGEGTYSKSTDPGTDQTTVDVKVICERRNDTPESTTYVRWYLVRHDDRWKLHYAEVLSTE